MTLSVTLLIAVPVSHYICQATRFRTLPIPLPFSNPFLFWPLDCLILSLSAINFFSGSTYSSRVQRFVSFQPLPPLDMVMKANHVPGVQSDTSIAFGTNQILFGRTTILLIFVFHCIQTNKLNDPIVGSLIRN